jgi:hypothetical protein
MSSHVYVVERAVCADDWKIVKVFSLESTLKPWLETVKAYSFNVHFRVHKAPLDFIADDEPYTLITNATKKRKRELLSANADLAIAQRDEKPAEEIEAMHLKVEKARNAVSKAVLDFEEKELGGPGGVDEALMGMPAATPV